MVLGADTGFFIRRAAQQPRAINIWDEARSGTHLLVVSTLTVAELYAYYYKRGRSQTAATLVSLLQLVPFARLVPVSTQIAATSARYRTGLGLATVDSIVLATFLESACELALTTDSDFRIANGRNILPVEIL